MSETRTIEISEGTRKKLATIARKFKKLNTGSTGDEFWIASSGGGGYEWTQIDLGVNTKGELIYCQQSGCSCNGPEQPSAETTYPLNKTIVLSEDYDFAELEESVKELETEAVTLYKVLTSKKVTAQEIIGIPNSEIRRAVLELVGYDKVLDKADVLDKSEVDGTLMRVKLEDDEDLVLVHVKDPSTTREYFLRVPPKIETARQARAWTFGFEPEDFELTRET